MNNHDYNYTYHSLRKYSEYLQTLYLTMFLSVITVENDMEFYNSTLRKTEKMISEMELDINLRQISKYVISIDESKLLEMNENLPKDLKHLVIAELLLHISISNKANAKYMGFIGKYATVLDIHQAELQTIAEIVKIILTMDKAKFKTLAETCETINLSIFLTYSLTFSSIYVANSFEDYEKAKDTCKNVVLANASGEGYKICSSSFELDRLVIINCNFERMDSELSFYECKKVIIKNCKFSVVKSVVINAYECEYISLLNCKFYNILEGDCFDGMNHPCLSIADVNRLLIDSCSFKGFIATPAMDFSSLGTDAILDTNPGIGYLENVSKFTMENSVFENCVSDTALPGEGNLFILVGTKASAAKECKTINCCPIGDTKLGMW